MNEYDICPGCGLHPCLLYRHKSDVISEDIIDGVVKRFQGVIEGEYGIVSFHKLVPIKVRHRCLVKVVVGEEVLWINRLGDSLFQLYWELCCCRSVHCQFTEVAPQEN